MTGNDTGQIRPYQVAAAATSFSTSAEVRLFNDLLAVWQRHLSGNLRNEAYYRQQVNPAVKLEDEAPEAVKAAMSVMGWPTKAVDMLVARSVLTGFTVDGDAGPLDDLFRANAMGELYRQAATSQRVSSCSFLTVGAGTYGEPDVVVGAHPATWAAALWDVRRRRIAAGMTVVDVEQKEGCLPEPVWVNVYTPERTYVCRRYGGEWYTDDVANPLGRPLMVPLRYRPDLQRPFGRPRISPAVRSLTDRALSVCFNTDVASYFYTWPQRYLAGVDRKTAEQLSKNKLELRMDKMLLVSANANGDIPHYGQMPQMSMQPYNDQLQTLAKLFSGETSIPMNSLGIAFDNPSSAEAIYAAQNDLICEAEWLNGTNGRAMEDVASMALAQLEGTTVEGLPEGLRNVRARFENPQRPSMAARADYAMKVASVVPEYAQTATFWRDLGVAEQDVAPLMAEVSAARAYNVLMAQAQPAPMALPEEGVPDGGDPPEALG